MFEADRFVEDCRAALGADQSHRAVREVITRAVRDPSAILRGLGTPDRAGATTLYRSVDLTIMNVVWAPGMATLPHDHAMWAVIGIYSGREDNIFWRRRRRGGARIEAAGARSLCVGDAEPLGKDVIHSVHNPLPRLTGALHVYGGDFFAADRKEWDSETLQEGRWDAESSMRRFEHENEKLERLAGLRPLS
jgi:predicted metal-dependent enzyme (double-stranded beta helix superfamily)